MALDGAPSCSSQALMNAVPKTKCFTKIFEIHGQDRTIELYCGTCPFQRSTLLP